MADPERVLITGAAGMVGSHLADRLAEGEFKVVGTSYAPTVDCNEIDRRVDLRPIDVRRGGDVDALVRDVRPSVIYHLAAQSYPKVSWELPIETFEANVLGTVRIFEAVKRLKIASGYDPLIVVACSSAEYGATLLTTERPVREDAALAPLHPYGVSKVAQDLLAYQYWVNDRIRAVRVRIFNTTGPRKKGDVVSDFARRIAVILREGAALRVGNLKTRRAILDVRDLISALILLSTRGTPGEVYNVSGTTAFAIGDLVDLFEQKVGLTLERVTDPDLLRPSDEPVIIGDVSKLVAATGWYPRVAIDETIATVLGYEITRLDRAKAPIAAI